jgi:putative FmdB family regulatory protein
MPIYKYTCKNKDCQTIFEEFYTSFKKVEEEEPNVRCPKCDSTEKIKEVSLSSFQLKGDGWANQGYAKTKRRT